eukprot:1137408-Pelagomonas_calceolata.AAC.2
MRLCKYPGYAAQCICCGRRSAFAVGGAVHLLWAAQCICCGQSSAFAVGGAVHLLWAGIFIVVSGTVAVELSPAQHPAWTVSCQKPNTPQAWLTAYVIAKSRTIALIVAQESRFQGKSCS